MKLIVERILGEPTLPSTVGQAHPAALRHGRMARPHATPEQWLSGRHTHAGRTLAYRLYVPSRPRQLTAPRPLLLMLHGCTQNPEDFAVGTGMNRLARQAGMLVLYPEQTHHDHAHKCWNWFKTQHQQRTRGEPALLADLVCHVADEHRADRARIYVAGLSAGGAMADILGRSHPDLFAAVGVHSGLPAGAAQDLHSAMAAMCDGGTATDVSGPAVRPLIVFHGDEDDTVHPVNGQALVAAARHEQGLAGAGEVQRLFNATRTVHRRGDGCSAVEMWALHGVGHAWSGGDASGSHTAPGGVDASAEMLRFFLQHRQPVVKYQPGCDAVEH